MSKAGMENGLREASQSMPETLLLSFLPLQFLSECKESLVFL